MTIGDFGVITSIAAAVVTGVFYLEKQFRISRTKHRQWLQGQWSNEGDVTDTDQETHYITLWLQVDSDDGNISGEVVSRRLNDDQTSVKLNVNGKFRFTSAKIDITAIESAARNPDNRPRVVVAGEARIRFIDKRNIRFTLIKPKDATAFPLKARLFRID